jgi:uncharacterized protein (TIGR02217 family)
MSFIDERLDEHVSYGFVASRTYVIVQTAKISGRVKRNAESSRPLHRFTAPYDSIEPAYHASLISTYNSLIGPVGSFRFKDWSEYQLDDVIIGTSDGSVDEEMQIILPYSFGTETSNTRLITKPVDSTKYNIAGGYVTDAVALSVTADDVPISFAVDYDTGIITISATIGEVIRVTGEFDVPVMFTEDIMSFNVVNFEAHSTDISLLEDFDA